MKKCEHIFSFKNLAWFCDICDEPADQKEYRELVEKFWPDRAEGKLIYDIGIELPPS